MGVYKSKATKNSIQYKWLWNSSNNPWINDPWDEEKPDWKEYEPSISDKIEIAFIENQKEIILNENYKIIFNFHKDEKHIQCLITDSNKQRPVIRVFKKVYFWYWNSSPNPWEKENAMWSPYDVNEIIKIEESFIKQEKEFNLSDYKIIFDYEKNFHIQENLQDRTLKRPVIRSLPEKIKNIVRIERFSNAYSTGVYCVEKNLSELGLFCYKSIFNNFIKSNENNSFLIELSNFVCLFHSAIQDYLRTEYVAYIKNRLKQLNKSYITFETLIEMLDLDFMDEYSFYRQYLVDDSEIFYQQIIAMYTMEGSLYKHLNQALRTRILERFPNLILYFLLLNFSLRKNELELKDFGEKFITYRGMAFHEEIKFKNFLNFYEVNNYIINFDFLSTSKLESKARSFMCGEFKVLLEYKFDKKFSNISCCSSYIEKYTQIPGEHEVLLCPNNILFVENIFHKSNSECIITFKIESNFFDEITFVGENEKLGQFNSIKRINNDNQKLVLEFKYFVLNDRSSDLIKKLDYLTNLKSLILKDASLDDSSIGQLAKKFVCLKNLQFLDISKNNISDKGASKISSSLYNLTTIQSLNLNYNQIKVSGVVTIIEAINKLENLIQFFHFNCNNLTLKDADIYLKTLTKYPMEFYIENHLANKDGINSNVSGICYSNRIFFTEKIRSEWVFKFKEFYFDEEKLANDSEYAGKLYFSLYGFSPSLLNMISEYKTLRYNEFKYKKMIEKDPNENEFIIESLPKIELDPLLSEMKILKNLQTLVFRRNDFTEKSIEILSEILQNFELLKQFTLTQSDLNDAWIIKLTKNFNRLSKLSHLDFTMNYISPLGFYSITENLKYFDNLEILNLFMNNITDEGINLLINQKNYLLNLKELNLGSNCITQFGFMSISQNINHFPALEELDLSMNKINSYYLTLHLKEFLIIKNLKLLDFRFNDISDKEAKEICKNYSSLFKNYLLLVESNDKRGKLYSVKSLFNSNNKNPWNSNVKQRLVRRIILGKENGNDFMIDLRPTDSEM